MSLIDKLKDIKEDIADKTIYNEEFRNGFMGFLVFGAITFGTWHTCCRDRKTEDVIIEEVGRQDFYDEFGIDYAHSDFIKTDKIGGCIYMPKDFKGKKGDKLEYIMWDRGHPLYKCKDGIDYKLK